MGVRMKYLMGQFIHFTTTSSVGKGHCAMSFTFGIGKPNIVSILPLKISDASLWKWTGKHRLT